MKEKKPLFLGNNVDVLRDKIYFTELDVCKKVYLENVCYTHIQFF